MTNVDAAEIAKFSSLASSWWDLAGPSRTLHEINPCRLEFITGQTKVHGRRVLDVGCGGGILSESLAAAGAVVTGIDGSAECIAAAREHAATSPYLIDYEAVTLEQHQPAAPYPLITCMELLEHVPAPWDLLANCRSALTPDGELIIATLNRTPRAYVTAVIGAEYVLRLLPRGTHDYKSFIRPAELARWLRAAGFELVRVAGMHYNPITRSAVLTEDCSVNYLVHARVAQ